MKLPINQIVQGDALEVLKTFPDESINCSMTSPPYWALRDYGKEVQSIFDGDPNCEHDFKVTERKIHSGKTKSTVQASIDKKGGFATDWTTTDKFCNKCGAWKGQLGLEPTFDLFIKHLCDIYDEVYRVLRKDGTCWVNLGDTYFGGGKGEHFMKNEEYGKDAIQSGNKGSLGVDGTQFKSMDYPSKCLTMIPQRFAIEMVNRGWILRNVIIWHKPNCMPSSAKDRFTVDFEYIFFFVKNKKYWFEQQRESSQYKDREKRMNYGWHGEVVEGIGRNQPEHLNKEDYKKRFLPEQRSKRAVWKISPKPFPECHFAVYPEELCEIPLKSGCPEFVCKKCGKAREKVYDTQYNVRANRSPLEKQYNPEDKYVRKNMPFMGDKIEIFKEYTSCNCNAGFEGGIVLDPFMGSGTTGIVALKQNKRFIGIELNPEYIKMANRRLEPYLEQNKLGEYINAN